MPSKWVDQWPQGPYFYLILPGPNGCTETFSALTIIDQHEITKHPSAILSAQQPESTEHRGTPPKNWKAKRRGTIEDSLW
jgi:hypothetical protein